MVTYSQEDRAGACPVPHTVGVGDAQRDASFPHSSALCLLEPILPQLPSFTSTYFLISPCPPLYPGPFRKVVVLQLLCLWTSRGCCRRWCSVQLSNLQRMLQGQCAHSPLETASLVPCRVKVGPGFMVPPFPQRVRYWCVLMVQWPSVY